MTHTSKESFADVRPERQNLVSTMSKSEFERTKEEPKCKAVSAQFCDLYCNNGKPGDIINQAEVVTNTCGKQFPVLRTCPDSCILPKWTQMQGGFNGSVMTDKVFSSYTNPFNSNSVLPPVPK